MTPRTRILAGAATRWQAITSAVVIVIGCAVLLGWALNIAALKSVLPGLATMKANAALGFVLVGVGLWTVRTNRRLAEICAAALLLLSLLTLAEYLFGWSPGFDQWLVRDLGASAASFPGRMAPATALNFALLGLALWLASRDQYVMLAQFCALLVMGIALFALAGYLYSLTALYSFSLFNSIALHTTLTFMLAAVSVALLRPKRGFVAAISADTTGGFMARRLLPAVIVVPLVLGWLGLAGENLGLFGDDLGLSLTVLAIIILFAPLIWLNARLLNRIDGERKRGAEQIRKLNRTLALLSDINQAIVRLHHIPSLLKIVCKIAVETGEFRLIWIGLIDPATRAVTLAAHGGIGAAELEALEHVVSDPARMQNLVAGLEQAADHIAINDAQADERTGPDAREAAKALGYGSMVLLPLRVSGDLRGMITLCAEEANFFNDEELQLLDEMAGDIGFAMEFAEQEARREQAESALLESESRYHRALDSLLEGAQIIGYDWRYLYVNEAAAGHGQQGRDALIGKTMMEQYPGIETTEMFAALRTCMETRAARHFENEFVYPDGARAWFDLSVQPIPEGIFILSLDISERKQAEFSLKQYAGRMEILHEIDSGIIGGAAIQVLVEATLKHLRRLIPCQRADVTLLDEASGEALVFALGIDGDTTLGMGVRVPIPPDVFEGYDARHMRVFDDIRAFQDTRPRARRLVNEGLLCALSVALMDQERPVGVLGLFSATPAFFTPEYQEIAAEIASQLAIALQKMRLTQEVAHHTAELEQSVIEIRQAEEALREANETLEQHVDERTLELSHAKERVEAILDNSTDGILLVDRELRIQQTNAAFDTLFACDADDYFEQSLLRLIHADDMAGASQRIETSIAEQRGQYIDLRVRRKNGTLFDAELSVGYVNQDGLVCTIRDISERKAQERQLRLSASLQEAVSDAVIATDLDFHIQSWNRAAERTYGWSAEEVIGQRGPDVFKTEFAPGDSNEQILRGFQEHGFWTAEVVQRHKDGHAIHILGSMTLIKDAQGSPLGIVAVNHDITEWKQAEEALRDSEARYRLLADNVADMITRVDSSGNYVYVSPSSRAVLGYEPEELVGHSSFELIHPDDLGEAIRQQSAALSPNAPTSPMTYRARHKDGHFVWLETGGQIIWSADKTEVLGFITISRDLTDRKRAEEALALSEQRFSLLVNGVSDYAIYVLDTEGRVISWNPGAERIKGYSEAEIIGQHISRFYTPEDITEGKPEAVLQAAEREGHYVSEGWRVRKDGSRFWAEAVVTALRNSEGDLIGYTKITRDLTEWKLAEESLQQALEQERELGELKSRFVSMASHEFGTPLATILAAAETLSAYRARMTDSQIDDRIDNIRDQVGHLKDIIEDVLQLARIQAGRLQFNPVPVDLDAICRSVIDEFQSRPDITHDLNYYCDDGLREVSLDKRLMRQIINNLVSNAIKYSPNAKTVFIRLEYADGTLTLSVRDQGIGIPEADMKHLFEPFHRASNVGTISGTGLGLSITKEAVELHGGTIRVESEVGIGTTFVITIPLSVESENEHDENSNH